MDYIEALKEYTRIKQVLTYIVDSLYKEKEQDFYRLDLASLRNFDISLLEQEKVFYIGNEEKFLMKIVNFSEEWERLGLIIKDKGRGIFYNRYIIPIYDIDNKVIALAGYNRDSKPKYIYTPTKYYKKNYHVYNQQNIQKAIDLDELIVVEGLTDVWRLKSMGIYNVIGTTGAMNYSKIIQKFWDRFSRVIFIPDSDFAGTKSLSNWKSKSIYNIIHIPVKDKDIDKYLNGNLEHQQIFLDTLNNIRNTKLGLQKNISLI